MTQVLRRLFKTLHLKYTPTCIDLRIGLISVGGCSHVQSAPLNRPIKIRRFRSLNKFWFLFNIKLMLKSGPSNLWSDGLKLDWIGWPQACRLHDCTDFYLTAQKLDPWIPHFLNIFGFPTSPQSHYISILDQSLFILYFSRSFTVCDFNLRT